MVQQGVVELVIFGEFSLDLSAVVGGQEVLVVVELVGVRLVLERVDSCFVQDDALLQEEKTCKHESIAGSMEDVSLLSQVS